MKTLILSALFMLGLCIQGRAQDVVFEAKLNRNDLPMVVTNAISKDFPDFEIMEVSAIPVEFVGTDVVIHKNIKQDVKGDEYSTYVLKLEGKGREIDATYNSNGKLESTYEYLNDIQLPENITKMIAKKYPGWAITKDNYKLIRYDGKTQVERYKVILVRGNDHKKIFVKKNGNEINLKS